MLKLIEALLLAFEARRQCGDRPNAIFRLAACGPGEQQAVPDGPLRGCHVRLRIRLIRAR